MRVRRTNAVAQKEMSDASFAFNDARDKLSAENVTLRCAGKPKKYVDYGKSPSEQEAAALCEGCQVLELCDAFAEAHRAAWGVHGGKVWQWGRPLLSIADRALDPDARWRCLTVGCNPVLNKMAASEHRKETSHAVALWPEPANPEASDEEELGLAA